MKRSKDGLINSKLTSYEILEHAIMLQAVADVKETKWYLTAHDSCKCTIKEGKEAVQYIVLLLKHHGYSDKEISNIFRDMTPHNYKYDIVKEELKKRGIEL